MFNTNKKTIIVLFVIIAVFMSATACATNAAATDATVVPTVAVTVTTNEPTETATVTTPTPTPVTMEAVVMLPVPATYASLFDGTKIYSDGSRTIVLKTLVKGDQVTITGTSGQYGVTAEGSFVNLHLMSIVITVTPTPAETSAAPTDPTTAATTKATTAATTKATTPPAGTTAATTAPAGTTAATTAATTKAPVTSLSASEVESIVWSAVMDARNANGFTTNKSDLLSAACRNHASSYTIGHPGKNGTWESCGSIGQLSNGGWRWGANNDFATLEECVVSLGNYLVTVHVDEMASTAAYTEFGVGVAKKEAVAGINRTEYYVYISCSSPEDLQWQIDQGWYS